MAKVGFKALFELFNGVYLSGIFSFCIIYYVVIEFLTVFTLKILDEIVKTVNTWFRTRLGVRQGAGLAIVLEGPIVVLSGCGGIGRRAGFRCLCPLRTWRFDSSHPQ